MTEVNQNTANLTDAYAAAAAAIRANAKLSDGKYTVPGSTFYAYADSKGVSRAVCDSVHELMEQYLGGAMVHATDLLVDRVEEAKKAGGNGKDAAAVISLRAGPYSLSVTANAHTVAHSPQNPDEAIDKFGTIRVRMKTVASGIPAGPAASAKERLSALLGV